MAESRATIDNLQRYTKSDIAHHLPELAHSYLEIALTQLQLIHLTSAGWTHLNHQIFQNSKHLGSNMSINDLDWAQEVEDALAEQIIDDLIEAHARFKIWLSGTPVKENLA